MFDSISVTFLSIFETMFHSKTGRTSDKLVHTFSNSLRACANSHELGQITLGEDETRGGAAGLSTFRK